MNNPFDIPKKWRLGRAYGMGTRRAIRLLLRDHWGFFLLLLISSVPFVLLLTLWVRLKFNC